MKSIVLAVIVVCGISGYAMNELGPLVEAQKNHPAVFVSGNVLKYTVADAECYVFHGESERCFEGDMGECDSELYQEAELDSRSKFFQWITKGDKGKLVEMSGASKMYEYCEGKLYHAICFVPTANVSVSNKDIVPPVTNSLTSVVVTNLAACCEGKRVAEVGPVGNQALVNVEVSNTESRVNRTDVLLDRLRRNPNDCALRSKIARSYVRDQKPDEAKSMYMEMVGLILADEKMDKYLAADLLFEVARHFEDTGDYDLAIKCYRYVVRCDGLRRWRLVEEVNKANSKVAELLLK